jgi:hypothetical protein
MEKEEEPHGPSHHRFATTTVTLYHQHCHHYYCYYYCPVSLEKSQHDETSSFRCRPCGLCFCFCSIQQVCVFSCVLCVKSFGWLLLLNLRNARDHYYFFLFLALWQETLVVPLVIRFISYWPPHTRIFRSSRCCPVFSHTIFSLGFVLLHHPLFTQTHENDNYHSLECRVGKGMEGN